MGILAKINHCFLSFGMDPIENINRLTALCGEHMGATWALYSYLNGSLLHSIGRWQTPPDLKAVGKPNGQICSDVIARGGNEVIVVRNLPETTYAQTDRTVIPYGLLTYVGCAVRRHGHYIGSLCVVYQQDFVPSEADRRLMGIIASAIGFEEERKKAEQAVVQAYDDTELILASLPSAILVVNEAQMVVWASPLACQYFSGGRGTLVGHSLSEILPPEEARGSRLVIGLKSHTGEQGSWKQDREFEAQDHIYRYRCFPVAMRGSERPQTGFVIRDVTEEKQLLDRLIQAEKLAGLGTMVSVMAHEINSPAQAILGLAEVIMEEPAPEKTKEYAGDIVGYAQHVGAVVRDFASYARSTSREGETELDLTERLSDAVKMVQRGPHFGQVEVVTQFQPLPPLRARRIEIDQLFVNIISNAVHAMKDKGCLTLCTCRQAEKMIVSISDTGCGIPKAMLTTIFDPFFTAKDPGKGTGLGLSIVYRIVAKYGGKIKADSEEGRGSTFTIEFPVVSHTKGGVSWRV